MTNDNTRIEWTDATWNPTTGCSKVSAGCTNCYAEAVSTRFGHTTKPWTHPHAAENVRLRPERLEQPLRWKRPRRIFVDSMSDLFHELVPDSYIDDVFTIMSIATQHTFQVLTKRPERMRAYLTERDTRDYDARLRIQMYRAAHEMFGLHIPERMVWPLPNVWLGTSVEDQRAADLRIPELIETPAAIRFLSCEPLLGEVRLDDWLYNDDPCTPFLDNGCPDSTRDLLHWVIVGGESGPKHRPFDLAWAKSLRDQCLDAHVPFFFKQVGGRTPKAGGRELDGRTWDEMPAHLPTDRLAAPAA